MTRAVIGRGFTPANHRSSNDTVELGEGVYSWVKQSADQGALDVRLPCQQQEADVAGRQRRAMERF